MIPKRIRHKGVCDHPQTPYARRKCRAAKIAAILKEQPSYQPGDEIDVNGTVIILGRRKGSTGIRWSWYAPELGLDGLYWPTPEQAIDNARRTLSAPRCACGAPATMNASTRRTCVSCYDRYAD